MTFCPQPVSGSPPGFGCGERLLVCRGSQSPRWGSVVLQNSQNSAELCAHGYGFLQCKDRYRGTAVAGRPSPPRRPRGQPTGSAASWDTRSSLGVQGISWGQSHTMADCPPSSPAPPEVKLISPTLNHIVGTDYLARPKVLGKQRHSNQAGHSQGSQVAAQELGKSQACLWNVQG